MVKESIIIVGGCRSGKSRHALDLAEQIPGDRRVFIATCVPSDDEMRQRVARHQQERGQRWSTIEVPVHLPEAIVDYSPRGSVILVDCLTLWISNLLLETDDLEKIIEHVTQLTYSLEKAQCPVIIVSNEVGTGIVPENTLARLFRDAMGFANQQVAACSNRVIWMVAGIPVTIKGKG